MDALIFFSAHPHNHSVVSLNDLNCTVACPTLQDEPGAWPLWIIVGLYSLVFLLSSLFLFQSRQQGLASFKNWFLFLQSAAAALRVLFFSVCVACSARLPWTFFTLNLFDIMLPIYLQFVTVSLLIVFLWKCIFYLNNQQEIITRILYPVAGGSFAILGVVCAVYAFLADKYRFMSDGYDRMCALYATFLFAAITVLLSLAAARSYRIIQTLAFSEDKRRKVNTIKLVFLLYVLVFFGRTIWCGCYAADINVLQSYLNDIQKHSDLTPYYSSMALFYFVFEVVPSLGLVLMLYTWLPLGRTHVLMESGDPGINTPLIPK